MAFVEPPGFSQRLCEPEWLLKRFYSDERANVCSLEVESRLCKKLGHASEEEFKQLVSSSFHQTLKEALPYPETSSGVAGVPGGPWFWEVYRHALFGENVVVHMGGTAVSLTEDSLDAQAVMRAKVCASYAASTARSRNLLENGAAKLEIVFAIAISVAMHVAKLPVLDRGEGPRAVVLCATQLQCAELSAVLGQVCSSLHLVVHNLFEEYPRLPADRRADVVVGTPPLWTSVSQLGSGSTSINFDTAAHLGGLEDLLVDLAEDGQLPPAYNLSRWRPYNLVHVEQLVFFDAGLQVNMGFGAILLHLLEDITAPTSPSSSTSRARRFKGRLPLSCQQYVVFSEDRWCVDSEGVGRILEAVSKRGFSAYNNGIARIGLSRTLRDWNLCTPRKRPRSSDEDEVSVSEDTGSINAAKTMCSGPPVAQEQESPAEVKMAPPNDAFAGLLIRNAVSHARLTADFDAFTDFTQRLVSLAEEFWQRFEEGPAEAEFTISSGRKKESAQASTYPSLEKGRDALVLSAVQVDLALLCVPLPEPSFHRKDFGGSINYNATHHAQELVVWVHSSPAVGNAYASRFALLFRHLAEQVSGELFDGSIVQCILSEEAKLLPYSLRPLATPSPISELLIQGAAFEYGQGRLQPFLLEVIEKSAAERCSASAERTAERRRVVSARKPPKSEHCQDDTTIPPAFFLGSSKGILKGKTFRSSLPPVPLDVGTVVVFRKLPFSMEQGCRASSVDLNDTSRETAKPFILHIVEECCQYGRVLSYYTHEDYITLQPSEGHSPDQTLTEPDESREQFSPLDSQNASHVLKTAVISLFVEFASSDAAIEAARVFAFRFAGEAPVTQQPKENMPRVGLFRNTIYYQGVEQDTEREPGRGDVGEVENESNDSFFDELLTESLLADTRL